MLWRNSYEMQLWIRDRHDTQLITCCATDRFFLWDGAAVSVEMSNSPLTSLLPRLLLLVLLRLGLAAHIEPGRMGVAAADHWAGTFLSLPLAVFLHRGHLCGDAVLPGIGFNSGTAGGVSGQAGAALGALVVHVQVVADVRLSVTLFLWKRWQ